MKIGKHPTLSRMAQRKASKDRKANLERLFDITVEALLSRIQSDEVSAADLQAARQLLKDNGINANSKNPPANVRKLIDSLPEFEDDDIPTAELN